MMMKQSPREKLAGTSLSLALLSFVAIFIMPVAVPYIFASISIVLAVLSMGGKSTMPRKSRTGFRISIVALILNTALILFAIDAGLTILCMTFIHAVTARLKIEHLFKFYWTIVSALALISLILVWIGL